MTRFFQVRIDDDVYQACIDAADKAGVSLQRWGAAMIAEWLGRPARGPQVVPAKHQATMEKVAAILSSGDAGAIRALTTNVNHFHERLRPAGSTESPHRT